MSTSYTVFLSDAAAADSPRGQKGDRESEPQAEIQLAAPEEGERGREHKMLFDSSAVIATKGCKWTATKWPGLRVAIQYDFEPFFRPLLGSPSGLFWPY